MAGEITPPTSSYPTAAALGNIPLSSGVFTATQTVTVAEAAANAAVDAVEDYIGSTLSTVWKAGGSKAPTDLTSTLLVAANEGKVYNMSASGTTDANFVEGSGKPYAAGTDVAVINNGTAASPVYKFNVLAASDSSVVKSVNGISPTNGNVTIPNAGASVNGLMTSGQYTKLSGIATGAEVNQNAFSKIAVSGVTGTGDAASKTDTLTLVPGNNVTMSRSGKSVTINATVPSGVVLGVKTARGDYSPNASGIVDLTSGAISIIVPDSGNNIVANSCGQFSIHGSSGISVYSCGQLGQADLVIDGSSISDVASGAASGVTALSGVVSGLKNFSKITVRNSSGNAVTNGEITPGSNADTGLGIKAGSNVTLSTSGKNIVIAATAPVTDGKIYGGSSLLSGTTIVIPWAGSGGGNLGVVALDDYPDENNNIGTSGIAIAATPAAVATRVSKSVLDTNVTKVSADTQTPASYDTGSTLPNTIYGLIRAIKITNDASN